MEDDGINRRRLKRIYFPQAHVVEGTLILSGTGKNDLRVKILNLSEGGLFFIHEKEGVDTFFQEGDTLHLKDIKGPDPLNLRREVAMEVKWVSGDDLMENIGYGCEFIDLPIVEKYIIRDVVTSYIENDHDQ